MTGGDGVVVNGTLNVSENTAIVGALTGTGTINKTGGDSLALAGDSFFNGAVNVSDASTLDVGDGSYIGTLSVMDGSTLVVAGEGTIGKVFSSSVAMDSSATVKIDAVVSNGIVSSDLVQSNTENDLNGATIELNMLGNVNEAAVADQTRVTVISGRVVSAASEDVSHTLDTLNVWADSSDEGVDLVFSKNYKGADKTPNQAQTANGVASINEASVQGTKLGDLLDAFANTRSEGAATAGLDSVGGYGLTALQKAVTDDSHEHLQTLRSTLSSVNAGLVRGRENVNAWALSGSVTGGTTEVNGNGNADKYKSDRIGFIAAGARSFSENTSFGAAVSYSYTDADCLNTSVKANVVYFDAAFMHKKGRFSQMATMGAGLWTFDTTRDVRVDAAGHSSFVGQAEGNTQGGSFNLSYEAAYDIIVRNRHSLSSVFVGEATFAQIDSMRESGLDNAGLDSSFDDVASLTFGFGGRYSYCFGEARNPGYFAFEALFVVETGDNTPKASNKFIGGGESFFLEGPESGNCGLRLNAGVLVPIGQRWGVFGNATSEFRSSHASVGGAVGVKYAF